MLPIVLLVHGVHLLLPAADAAADAEADAVAAVAPAEAEVVAVEVPAVATRHPDRLAAHDDANRLVMLSVQ